MKIRDTKRLGLVVGSAVVLIAAAACSSPSSAASSGGTSPSSGASSPSGASTLAVLDPTLKAQLPAKIRAAGVLNAAAIIDPPYASYAVGSTVPQGLAVDLAADLSTVLGIPVKFDVAPTATEDYSGLASGRYDISLSPTSDTAALEQTYDFVDWLSEYVVFAVKKGNPKNITSLASTCGATIGTIQGGSAVTVLDAQKAECASEGKPALTVDTYPDQSSTMLAVESGRTDAAFSSSIPLTYYVQQSQGSLELTGLNAANGFPDLRVGTETPKGNGLAPVILKAFDDLRKTGAYDALLKKYGITRNSIPAAGIDLATASS